MNFYLFFLIIVLYNYDCTTTPSKKVAQICIPKNMYKFFSKDFSTRKNYTFISHENGKKTKIIDENSEEKSAIHYDQEGKIEKISLQYFDEKSQNIHTLVLCPTGSLLTKIIQFQNEEIIERYQNGKCIMRWIQSNNKPTIINYFKPRKKKNEKTQYNISAKGLLDLSNIAEHKPPYYDTTGFTIDPITHIELDAQGKPTNPAFTDIILFD